MKLSTQLISARRNDVLQSYNSAAATNHRLFIEGNAKATEEYIFSNQMEDAKNIIDMFYNDNIRVVSIQKKTKVGADGLMIEIAKLLTTHEDDSFIINHADIRILTGMSNISWERDMINKAPTYFKDKIFHHGKLSKAQLMNIKNGLFIIDEIDRGDKEFQVLHNILKEAGILDVKDMIKNNNRFVFISATMIKELYDLYRWGDLHRLYKMSIPHNYFGHKDFLEYGILQEFYSIENKENANKWVQEDIINNYGNEYRVHIIRVTLKTIEFIQDACIRKDIVFRNHTSNNRLSPEEINEFFEETLTNHIVIAVKKLLGRADFIPNKWKLRIGATHEHYTKIIDYNVQVQGLLGRISGYWRSIIEAGHKTGPHRSSIKAVQEYEKIYLDPFGINSYQSSGFKKKNGKVVSVNNTMLSVKNIKNLIPIDLPEIDENPEYDITEPYKSYEELYKYIKSIISIGIITKYKNTDLNIKYRGITIPLYKYESKHQFKKNDIYIGINKISI